MHGNNNFSVFSEEEDRYYDKWKNFRDELLKPVCSLMAKYKIPVSAISYAGLLAIFPFIYFFATNPWISFVFLCVNIFMDSLDGPYSRYTHSESLKGAITDTACDHLSFLGVFFTLLYYGLMNYFWATLYILNYFLMLAFVIYCRNKKIKFFPIFRSKSFIYGFFLLMLITGFNMFNPVLVLFSVYMIITNILLFSRVRCSLR
jgi:phosphatidylglycerophosphate synthase